MSLDANDDERARAREEALQRHRAEQAAAKKPPPASTTPSSGATGAEQEIVLSPTGNTEPAPVTYGVIPRLHEWSDAAAEATKRKFRWLGPVTSPFRWTAVKCGHFLAWHWNQIAFRTDKASGQKHFSPARLAKGLLLDAALAASSPFIAIGTYYYATLQTYPDIFVPNAGVFVNQQFVHPSQPGHVIAPRDEIFTVLAQRVEDGKVEPMRFDLDSNPYFFFYLDAWRPDLAAAKMVPISPYGAMCTVKATGLYTRLFRPWRAEIVKWIDLRAEIVKVDSCTQLKEVPTQYRQVQALPSLPTPPPNGTLMTPPPVPVPT